MIKLRLLFLFLLLAWKLQGQELTNSFAKKSVLANGDFHKIAVDSSGVYKLDYAFFQSVGINTDILNINRIRVFGNPGGMLPQENNAARYDDLIENHLWVYDANHNKDFDAEDYLLFYAHGPDKVIYDEEKEMFLNQTNLYANTNFYFIELFKRKSEKIETASNKSVLQNSEAINSFDYFQYHETESINLLSSGREWYGEKFSLDETPTHHFQLKDYLPQSESAIRMWVQAMNRETVPVHFDIELNNQHIGEIDIDAVSKSAFGEKGNVNDWYDYFSVANLLSDSLNASSSLDIQISLSSTGENAEAYLDAYAIQFATQLKWKNHQFHFRSLTSKEQSENTYQVTGLPERAMVWNISQPGVPVNMSLIYASGNAFFIDEHEGLQEYIAFNPEQCPNPTGIGKVENQNLHGITPPELLIITPDSLRSIAKVLERFRENVDGLLVTTISIEKIYNEFSSGRKDVTAIRNFLKMLYDRNGNKRQLKYVLLFGDTSYDYRGIENSSENLIPIYQSRNSLHTVHSYASDDYFGFLDDDEGIWKEGTSIYSDEVHDLEIGVGRLPVRTKQEAQEIVEKLIQYQNKSSLGRWRTQLGFVADNGDANIHQLRSDYLATQVEKQHELYTPDRLFVGAYPIETEGNSKVSTEGRRVLDEFVEEGKLIIDYIGHGAETGWTNEKILTNGQAINWRNLDNMPVFITATCEYGRFDDWKQRSGAELSLMNPLGGPIALVTTTRPVVASTNFKLSEAFYDVAFEPLANGEMPRLGDIIRQTKNNSVSGTLNRNFSLLGDPSMKLAYPSLKVFTAYLNDQTPNAKLSIKSGEKLTVQGYIGEKEERVNEGFEGILEVIVYAAPIEKKTLGDSDNEKMTYHNREKVLYKGSASVYKGNFEFTFVMPDFEENTDEQLKISFYAKHNTEYIDAAGYYLLDSDVSGNDIENTDQTPPEVTLYLDDENFNAGDETGKNPVLYARLFDEFGINTADEGKSIKLVIDDEFEKTFQLNNYYENDLDSYQAGLVKFQMPELETGIHFITLQVWDNNGNQTETGLYFNVTEGILSVLENLIVHPNPSFDAVNFTFPVTSAETGFNVKINLYDDNGAIIQEIAGDFTQGSTEEKTLQWNGKGPGGYELSSGTYFYEIFVNYHTSSKLETTSGQFVLLH
ncbi:type IX secretion system sortase PorU [Chondrinema litorale]|uniref:type IX secretion system sortase PorU n=1 Tax=Chondrinema litorale TaxID=2994555 RepID=UPI00254366AE|nr:type IX secretion system sortase PorU [Chondrinema litorale]UZR99249.1 type IX secretion system sortase PorU [Chondrinema litorale]